MSTLPLLKVLPYMLPMVNPNGTPCMRYKVLSRSMFQPSVFNKGPCIKSQLNDVVSEGTAAGVLGTVLGLA